MVQELPRNLESDAQESRSINNGFHAASSCDTPIWPCNRAEADSRRDLLNRYSTQDTGKDQLPGFPGMFASTPSADLVFRAGDGHDIARLDSPGISEKVNTNGSRLKFNDDNTVSKLTRRDGSVLEINYENGEKKQLIESNKDGTARTVWNLNGKGLWESNTQAKDNTGAWVADGKPGQQRRDISVSEQGVTTAIDLIGFRHVTTADGRKLNEGARYTFDEKGRIESISYLPGENRAFKFHYDKNDRLDRVDVLNGEGKLQQMRSKTGEGDWKITKADGSSGGSWQGDMELLADGNFRQRDAKDRAAGQWQVTTPFENYTEKVSLDSKQITRIYNDKSIELEKTNNDAERVTRITRARESREFRYDADGKLAELVDTTAKGTYNWKTEGARVKLYPTGDVAFAKQDGSKVLRKVDFSSIEHDRNGNILKVLSKDGNTRSFEYENINNHKQLVKIVETRPGKNGESSEVWTRKKNSDGSPSDQFVSSVAAGGKEKLVSGVEVFEGGDYKFKTSDGKERIARLGKDSSSEGGFSASVEAARDRLKEALDGQLDASRKARLEGLMKELEKRGEDVVERQMAAGSDRDKATEKWEKKISQTYDQLAQMLEQNPSTAVYDQATRAKLVENFMWICADTTRGAQDVGNCWEMSGRNLTGMQNNPEAMARMLKEVSLTGSFTAVHGGIKSRDSLDRRRGDLEAPKKFNIPKNMLQIDKVNAGWSLDKPGDCFWRGGIGTMPSTPVGYILDNVIGFMGGRTSHGALDGGLWESFNSPSSHTREGWYYGINELMYMATGEKTAKPVRVSSNDISEGDIRNLTDKRLQKQLLENGGALLLGPGHMFAVKLIKSGNQWQIVADNQWGGSGDQVIGKVADLRSWNVQRTRLKYHTASSPLKVNV